MRIFIQVVVQFQVQKNVVQLRRKGKEKGKKEDLQGKKRKNNLSFIYILKKLILY